MTSTATVTARKVFDLIFTKLNILSRAGVIEDVALFGAFDERISIGTGVRGREIRLLYYPDAGAFNVQLWGIWLMKCKVISTTHKSYVNPTGELVSGESLWFTHGDPETIADQFVSVLTREILALYHPGQFTRCYTCSYQLACIANSPNLRGAVGAA